MTDRHDVHTHSLEKFVLMLETTLTVVKYRAQGKGVALPDLTFGSSPFEGSGSREISEMRAQGTRVQQQLSGLRS